MEIIEDSEWMLGPRANGDDACARIGCGHRKSSHDYGATGQRCGNPLGCGCASFVVDLNCAGVSELARRAHGMMAEMKLDEIEIRHNGRVWRVWSDRPGEIAEYTGESLATNRRMSQEFYRKCPRTGEEWMAALRQQPTTTTDDKE